MNEQEALKLYNALLGKGYSTDDLGDEQTFLRQMGDAGNRKQLYDWVSGRGDFRIGDYNSYEHRLSGTGSEGEHRNGGGDESYTFTEAQLAAQDRQSQPVKAQPSESGQDVPPPLGNISELLRDRKGSPKKTQNGILGAVGRMARTAKDKAEKLHADNVMASYQPGQFAQRTQQFAENLRKNRERTAFGLSGTLARGDGRLNTDTGKLERGFITSAGNEFDEKNKVLAEQEQRQLDAEADRLYHTPTLDEQLRDAYRERDALKESLSSREGPGGLPKGWGTNMYQAGHGVPIELDEDYEGRKASLRQIEKRIRTLEAERDDPGFWSSLATHLGIPEDWSFGIVDLADTGRMLRIKDKIEKAHEAGQMPDLSKAEQLLLRNTLEAQQASQQYDANRSAWYRAGQMGATSIKLIPDFIIGMGPMKGIATGVAKGVAKAGTKVLGDELAQKAIPRLLLKTTGVTAGTLAAGGAMVNTVQVPRLASETLHNMTGELTIDEKGQYQFADSESFLPALLHAEQKLIPEASSEVLGEFLPGAGQILSKLGLSKISSQLKRLAGTKWYKNYSTMLERTGFHGIPGEAIEEYGNDIHSAILGNLEGIAGDENGKGGWADLDKHIDIWLGSATLGGLLNAPRIAGTVYQGAQYHRYKHQTNVADAEAQSVFGADKWQPLRESIDESDNEHIGAVALGVLRSDMSVEQKGAALEYIKNLQQMRGYSLGAIANRKNDDEDTAEQREAIDAMEQGYEEGFEAETPDERKRFADEAQAAAIRLQELFGDERAQQMIREDADPVHELEVAMGGRGTAYSDEQVAAVADYFQKKRRAEGMMDAVIDGIDLQVQQANAEVRAKTHQQSGNVIMARRSDEAFYILGGDIDSPAGETAGTGGVVVVKNIQTGEVSVMSPQELSVYSMQPADALINQNETTLRQQLEQQADDDITFGSPASEVFEMEDTVALQDGNGGVIEGQIVTLPNAIDGVFVVQTNDGRALQLTADDMNRRIVTHNGMEVAGATQPQEAPAAAIQQQTEQGEGVQNLTENVPNKGNNSVENIPDEDNNSVENIPNEGETGSQSALSRIPVRTDASGQPVKGKNGRPILDWHKASVEDATDAMIESTLGDMVMARDTASDLVNVARAKLEKIRKQKPKGEDPIGIAESRMQIRRQEQEQQAIIKQWQDVGQTIRKRMEAESEARRAATEAAKSEEQRQREAEARRQQQEQQEQIARERAKAKIEEDLKNWNRPYQPLELAKREMAGDREASEILNDTEPRSLEEWVSSLLRPQSLMWNDEEREGRTVRGLKSELGYQWGDMQRLGGLIGGKGKGKPFGSIVHEIWEGLPEGMRNQYTDQDVRNTLLELFNEGDQKRMRNLTAEHRIEEARQMMLENQRRDAEAEMDAWAEAYHLNPEEREAYEEFMEQPPTAVEQGIIDQIIADNEQNQSSPAVDRQPDSGRSAGTVEGGEDQVQAEGEAEGGGNPAAPVAEAAEDGGNQPSVSGDEVAGGASDRQSLAILFEQIGASPVLAERMSDYEVGEMTEMVDEWEAHNDNYGAVIEQEENALRSKNKKEREAAQARIDEAQTKANEAFVPIEEYIEGLNAKYGIESEEPFEGAIPTPEIDTPRYNAIRNALIDAYRSGDAAAITAAAQVVQQYVDEGLNTPEDHTEIFDIAEEYDGNDPEKLADQYIIRTFWDRYLDDDADKEYIKTGLKPNMRKQQGEEGSDSLKDFVVAARKGNKEAQDRLNEFGIKWEKKPVVRFVAQGEVDSILAGNRYEGRFGNGRVDVTNSKDVSTAVTSEYRITFKDDLDWTLNDRLRMKNEELGDGYIMDGYSLDDVATIEKRNEDGTYTKVYDAENPVTSPKQQQEKEPYTSFEDMVADTQENVTDPAMQKALRKIVDKQFLHGTSNQRTDPLGFFYKFVYMASGTTKAEQGMLQPWDSQTLVEYNDDNPAATWVDEKEQRIYFIKHNPPGTAYSWDFIIAGYKEMPKPLGTTSYPEQIAEEEGKVDSNPTDGQKEAGNYQKGHIKVDGYDITIENPKGSVRSGVDAGGNRWETEMHNTYGYVRGTEGVDGDHIDMFLSDKPTSGNVYVVDQVNPSSGEFDEHKVMYGFASEEEARQAYLSNYSEGWQGLGAITEVSREDFKKWINSSHRKTKPFAEYKTVRKVAAQQQPAGKAAGTAGKVEKQHKRIVSDEQMEDLRKKLLDKFNNLNAGIDVERMLLGAMYAVGKIERGVTKFADYAREMVEEIGDSIRPYLKSFYNAVRDMPEAREYRDQMDSAEYVENFDEYNFDKQQSPDPITKAQQVIEKQQVRKQTKKIRQEHPNLFGDLFAEPQPQPQQVEQGLSVQKPKLDKKDYRTYMTKEAQEYFAHDPRFSKFSHPELAFVTAAVWDGVVIPVEELAKIPAIVEAEHRVKAKEDMPSFTITAEEIEQHAQHLLDAEHGSAVFENGKLRKVDGNEDFSGAVKQERKAFVVIGRPAGGKSSVFANSLSSEHGARIIDSDMVKEWFDEFDDGYGAGYVQEMSTKVADRALDIAAQNGDNIILPRIGGNSVLVMSAALRMAGYDVQLYYNDVVPETSYMRSQSRFAMTGRYLSLEYLTSIKDKPSKIFSKFAEKSLGDYIHECTEEQIQKLRGRLESLVGGQRSDIWRTSFRSLDERGRRNSDGTVSGNVERTGANGDAAYLDLSAPIFSYAEWKSNDVAFGEKPKEIWNSKSGKPMPGQKEEKKNEVQSEQGLSGEPLSSGEGERKEGRGTGPVRERLGTEQDRPERTVSQEPAKPKQEPQKNKRNNQGKRGEDYAPTSPKARFNANVEAIRLMRDLTDQGIEVPTKEQMAVLRQYSGWGGLGTYFNDEHSAENRLLRDLLSEEEYNDAALSINSAYFTPAFVIDSMWDIAEAMGFKGGNVLEGSAGIGNIIGQMPSGISRRSNIEAVEIDKISGNILKLLYPDAKVHIQGFQDTMIRNGSVDLAITNVPFVTGLQVFDKVDKDLSRRFTNIHDFCIAKNIRKLREGGIGIFITSRGTLDNSNDLRAWITDEGQADVVGAFRLNNETFGGTTVTSDIIVVRKRLAGKPASTVAIDVSKASPLKVGTYEDKYGDEHQVTMVVNDYFKEHPEMMAGEMAFGYEKGDTYRPGSYGLYPVEGKDQQKMLTSFAKSMSKIREDASREAAGPAAAVETNQLTAEKEGRMLIDDKGRLCVSQYGEAVPLNLNAQKVKGQTKEQCFKDYQAVQKNVDDVLQQQLNDPDDTALKPKLEAVNKAYDTFVKRYGYLHKNTSISFLRNDIDFPSFLALENYSETKDMKGKVTVTVKKAPLFTERVLGFKTEPHPKTVKDAVVASMFRSNGIDLGWIANKLNEVAAPPNGEHWTTDDVRKGILVSRLGFEDPSTGQLEIRYKYLSGNVREKLAIAEAYNTDGKYAANIEELRKVVPMDIPAHLIDFSLGSSWIPMELYHQYLEENYDLTNVKLSHIEGMWVLDPQYRFHNEKNRSAGVYSEQFRETIYGHQLVAAALNNRPVKVAKQVSEGYGSSKTTRTVVDQAATQACAVRMDEIKDEFRQWAKKKMQEDAELAERIEKIYNDKFNALVPMQIDDEFLPEHFEGANMNITLRPHQKRGALRDLTSPTMLAHEVGTGKSFTLLTTAMEMRRLGTAKKPMIVVQNATVAQMTADAKLLYPNAKVLSLSEKDRTAEGRRSFYAKIKYNDWDIIIIPQSTLNMIPDSPERELQFIQEKIDEKKHVIEAAEAAGVEGRELDRLKRELEKIEQEYGDTFLDNDSSNGGRDTTTNRTKKKDAKREAASLDKAKTSAQKMLDRQTDDVQYFDDLGVDAILVDEAHEYKHLGFQTSIGRGIKGIDPSYSKKCAGLYNKTRSVFDKVGWKNVVFATGTPISNTAAEIWTFMKYLMPADVMKANDIYYFDDFVHNFGNISQSLEFQTNGKFKEVTRFAAYFNKPELIRIWTQVADIVRTEDTTVQDKIPAKENGKDQDVFLQQSPSLISIMAAVRSELERFEKMDGRQKKENSHIPLTMYGIAKRAAIDPRLVNPDAPDEPLSKTNAAVKEIVKDLKATQDYKGTVAVFCDNQNRKGADGNIEFNIFDDMKAKLIAQGVPESQIAIIKSGMSITAKQKIFDAVNTGDIRVVLGSTQTLGTGVNMQERLHLLIHMDAPDRPMDYTQRNGRIERQGNLHKEWGKPIRILRFGVEDSLDVTAYQRLKTKSGFIDSIMDGKESLVNNQVDRTVEEEEEGLFDNPVAVLSGSQYALKKNQAERELRKYQGKKAQWEADQVYVANAIRRNKAVVNDAERQISEEQKQLDHIKGLFPDGKVKTITIQGVKVDAGNGETLAKVMKEKVNDPVNAIVKRNRENAFYNDEVVPVKIELDGHAIDFEVSVERESVHDNGRMRTVIHKYVTYKSADLREERMTKSASSVKDILEDILEELVTGRDYQDRIDALNQKIDRLNAETEQLQQRVGIEFQFDKELEQAKKQVEEYTELMRREMEEKEAKYAQQQTEAVDLSKAESEDDEDGTLYSADEDVLPDHILRVLDALENEHPGFNDAFSVDPGLETGLAEVWVSNREAAMQLYKNEHPDAQGDYYFSTYMWAKQLFEDKLRDPSLQTDTDELPDFAVDAEQQRGRIIGTDNFKGFFGDWQNDPENASKVVDADGMPLILYHGTKLEAANKRRPFWIFYPNSHFGTVGQADERVHYSNDRKYKKVYPVYLNIRNPKRVSDVPDGWLETHSEWWEKQIKRAKEEGYDGIVYLNRYEDREHPADSWIAFNPEQVKSAQENVGTYDPTNPDIRYRDVERFREGQTFPIVRTDMQSSYNVLGRSNTYSTELMPDAYSSEQALLDAVRNQYPEYYVTIEDGSLRMESWRHVMAAYKNAETESQRTRKDASRKSYVERKTRNAINAVKSLAAQMGLDVEILTTTDGLEGKKARAKGFFNPKTGKITLVLPNHANQSDLIKTLLHEGVAHFGLRKMFGPHFATFLDNVYNNVSPEIKRRIDAAMKKNGWSRHTATEEYLARLAERTDFEHASSQGWWQKIKEFFVRMLAEVGVRLFEPLRDNELRYILWRSYDNLLHPDRRRSIFDTAKEITMQRKLGINRYARERERLQRTGRTDTSRIVAEADSRFNEGVMEADETEMLMRDDDAWVDDVASEVYEKAVAQDSLKWQEAWQDSMISLKAIQDAIAQETGKVATGAEDAYLFENRMHGRAKNMSEQYDWRFYRPMLKAFNDFCKQLNYSQEQGMDYLISKSGLERNMYYTFRDGAKAKLVDDIKQERDKLEKDYAKKSISEADYLTRKQELEEQERTGLDDFMQKVREMYAYQHAKEEYDAGNISYSEYLRITEAVIRGQLKRSTPKKDADGNVVSDNYYDEHQQDYSGLTETFAKDLYDAAQQVKKQAQRTIDPQQRRALWSAYNEQMRNAYTTARQVAEDAVFAAEDGESKATSNDLWDKINAATKETLRQSYESGLIDRNNYNKVREMFNWYIPLRGWEENKASDVYTYMGRDNVFSPAVKKTWGRKSKAENPLAYIGNIAISTILSGHRNQMKQHFLNYVMNNPTSLVSISESWYENIAPEGESPVWILRSADTAGKSGDEIAQIVSDFNDEMRQKQGDGKAMPVRGRLRLDVNATKGQKAEHVVEVQRAGHTYQLYINGNPKAAQALNGSAAKAVSRISDTWLGKKITGVNRSMAAFFTSKNPAFVVSNLSRDLNMAGASVAVNEGKEYNARFIANVAKVLRPRFGESSKWVPASKQPTGLMPSLMRKWQKGTLDETNETERLFKEFMDEGGETGFVNMLSIDSFKDKMKKELAQMNGSSLFGGSRWKNSGHDSVKEVSVMKGLRLLGDTFEFYNRCAEDSTRFIVYMTSRQMGKTLEESIADAKDVTLNFNRKGTGGLGNAEVRDLFIFVNPAIQALANMYRMAKGHPLKFGAVTAAFVAGGALMPILNQWLLNMFGDDDDKQAYWNLPPWVRKNNLVMWIPFTKNFITIPLAQEFRVFYGVGEMVSSAVMDHPVDKMGLEIFSSVADLVPINPTGNGGNLMVDFAPTMVQPLMQVGENIDFTGKPIWRENQGNKHAPMYTKAYVSTPTWMVKISESLNNLTGGNEGKKGAVERYMPFWGDYINNPAVWNHLLQGYFGGMYNTIAKTFDVGVTAASGELPKIYQTPVINRFLNRPVERDNAGVLGEDYYNLTERRDALRYELRIWQKKAADGEEGAQEHVNEILSSDEWKRAEVISHYERIIKDLKAGEKAATESVDKYDIKQSISMYKEQMLEELAALDSGKDPLEAAMEQFDRATKWTEKNKLRLRIEKIILREGGVGSTGKMKTRTEDVEKALAFIRGEEVESHNVQEQYLRIATADDIRDDALIRAGKAKIKAVTAEYKKLQQDGRQQEAANYKKRNQPYFNAETTLNSLGRSLSTNKKLLGKGNDESIMKLIRIIKKQMLKSVNSLN